MNILVNVFHPNLESSSVNSLWVKELRKTKRATINLLYSNYPDWEIDINREQGLLASHDRIVFQYPFYWYSTPPLMKKWLDDVLTFDWAYGPNGTALQGKDWVSAISTGLRCETYQAGGDQNFSMSELLKPLQQTATLVGMTYLSPFVYHDAERSSALKSAQSAKKFLLHITNRTLNPNCAVESISSKQCETHHGLKH